MDSMTTMGASAVVIACLAAVAGLTLFWRIATHRPVRPRPHLEGRRAAGYYYSPTGLQDERGIVPRPAEGERGRSGPEVA